MQKMILLLFLKKIKFNFNFILNHYSLLNYLQYLQLKIMFFQYQKSFLF